MSLVEMLVVLTCQSFWALKDWPPLRGACLSAAKANSDFEALWKTHNLKTDKDI